MSNKLKFPFQHDELEVKQRFLSVAREFWDSGEAEKQFASALIYANLADYLSTHLHESLKLACNDATRRFYNGVIAINMDDESSLPLGKVINGLKRFTFPSKELILPLLERIKKNRDKVMHGLLKTPSKQLMKDIDKVFEGLRDDVEQLVIYVDEIYRVLPPKSIVDNFIEETKKLQKQHQQEK